MPFTTRDMQREVLLAANKAQTDATYEEIAGALREIADKLAPPPEAPPEGGQKFDAAMLIAIPLEGSHKRGG